MGKFRVTTEQFVYRLHSVVNCLRLLLPSKCRLNSDTDGAGGVDDQRTVTAVISPKESNSWGLLSRVQRIVCKEMTVQPAVTLR